MTQIPWHLAWTIGEEFSERIHDHLLLPQRGHCPPLGKPYVRKSVPCRLNLPVFRQRTRHDGSAREDLRDGFER
jgi:hypothetical protein